MYIDRWYRAAPPHRVVPIVKVEDMKSSRALLIVILATAGLYVSAFGALGSSFPTIDSSGEEIVEWFTLHGARARALAWTAAFISLGLAIFGAQVASLLPRSRGYIFLGGALGWAITSQVQAWFWAGLAFHPQDLDPSAARTIFAIPAFWGPLINGSSATMAAAFIPLGFGELRVVPNWLTWLSLVFFLEQSIETITVFGQSGFLAPGGTMNVYLGGVVGFAWGAGVVYWAIKRMNGADNQARRRLTVTCE